MGIFGGNSSNGFRPTRSTPLTKVTSSGRRVSREKTRIAYQPPARSTRQQVRRTWKQGREDYQEGRYDRAQARKGGWGLFSR